MSDIHQFRVSKPMKIRGYEWLIGIAVGLCFVSVAVIGTTLLFLSIILFIQAMLSEHNTCARTFNKGLKAFKNNDYLQARVLFREAYEIDIRNDEVIRMLLIVDLYLGDALSESRMLLRQYELATARNERSEQRRELQIFNDALSFNLAR